MLVSDSTKIHPEFDLSAARKVYAESPAEKELAGELVTSPYDLFAVETLRDRHDLRYGESIPADVFVFGKGEPPRPDLTKFGGRPYWPVGRPWPVSPKGKPLLFIAQFCFADSRDIFQDLPGDVLLLFGNPDFPKDYWPWQVSGFHFEWVTSGQPHSPIDGSDPIMLQSECFFGSIFRTADYPDSVEKAFDLPLSCAWSLSKIASTKIGGEPFFIQNGCNSSGRFLCQLGSIQAAPDVPYPWVNRQEPLNLGFDNSGIHGASNEAVFDDMGFLYLYLKADGSIEWFEESF